MSRWAFGPRLQAAVVTLAVRNRVSRRDTTELARELFGVELSIGSVDAIIQRAGDALAGPYTELEQRIKTAAAVNIDETGWKTCGGGRTLWGALTSRTAVFRIAAGRHAFEARALLGERFAGIVCSDRWRGYDYLDPSQRQLCWAHLLRDFTGHSEGMAEQKQFGSDGLTIACDLFAAWKAYQADGDRARLQAQIAPLQTKLRALLEHAARTSTHTKYHRDFARNLLKRWPGLWTFTHTDGVEPTNNHAERGLRGAIIYRKLSLGSQSERGEPTTERLLSASITCTAPKTAALHLPHPSPRRPRPRRSSTRTHLTEPGLNAYGYSGLRHGCAPVIAPVPVVVGSAAKHGSDQLCLCGEHRRLVGGDLRVRVELLLRDPGDEVPELRAALGRLLRQVADRELQLEMEGRGDHDWQISV